MLGFLWCLADGIALLLGQSVPHFDGKEFWCILEFWCSLFCKHGILGIDAEFWGLIDLCSRVVICKFGGVAHIWSSAGDCKEDKFPKFSPLDVFECLLSSLLSLWSGSVRLWVFGTLCYRVCGSTVYHSWTNDATELSSDYELRQWLDLQLFDIWTIAMTDDIPFMEKCLLSQNDSR